MKRGKYEAATMPKNSKSNKAVALLLSLTLLIGCVVGGTLAWLMDTTDPVTNTFSPANIKITLTETNNTDTDNDGTDDAWTAHLIPGKTYFKNPVVGVDGEITDVDCYLFVRMVERGNPSTYLDYESLLDQAAGWTQVPNTTDVWYRIVEVDHETKSWNLIDSNQVTVKNTLKKEDMPEETVSLSYEAYAIQLHGFENNVNGAWEAAYAQKTN